MDHSLGFLEDAWDPRDWQADQVCGTIARDPPGACSVPGVDETPENQGGTSSCVAFAICAAVETVERGRGITMPRASRRYLYYIARARQCIQGVDAGSSIRSAFAAASKIGIAPETSCKWDPALINERASFAAVVRARDRGGLSYGFLEDRETRAAGVRLAIAGGFPVVIGMRVDKAFLDNAGPPVIDSIDAGDVVGGHAMWISEYDGDRFRLRNSWGSDWRQGGSAWITKDLLQSHVVRTCAVCNGWQALQLAR